MKKRKTHFEQVPIEVAEKVQHEATTLAEIQQTSPALFSARERKAVADFVKDRGELPPKESR